MRLGFHARHTQVSAGLVSVGKAVMSLPFSRAELKCLGVLGYRSLCLVLCGSAFYVDGSVVRTPIPISSNLAI